MLPILFVVRVWSHLNRPPAAIAPKAIFQGVTYERVVRTTPRPLVLHFVTVDLTAPGLNFLVTPPDKPGSDHPLLARTTSAFLRESQAKVAINGDFYFPYHPQDREPVGIESYASSRGIAYGKDGRRWTHPALCVSRENQAVIRLVRRGETAPYNAIGGDRLLLENGQVTAAAKLEQRLNPRTGVGLDKSGRHLLMLVADGRQPGYSEGVTLEELAGLLREKGAFTALNFDGGGSCTLAVQPKVGQVEVWNRPVNSVVAGTERPVANHLAFFAASLK